jgi:hypothetical protein
MPRTFYRIVHDAAIEQLDPDDFTSDAARGEEPPDDPELRRLHDGISVFATEAQAMNKARDYPFLGRYVARLEVPDDAPFRIERTLRSRGHHTMWGDPVEIRRCAVAVVRV